MIFEEEKAIPQSEFFPWLRQSLNLESDVDFQVLTQERDELGITHFRYSQIKKGIPVDMATIHVEVKDGKVVSFNGDTYNLPDLSETPAISEAQALQHALSYVGASNYMWENPFWESEIKQKSNDVNATYYPKGELYWGRVRNASGPGEFRLAYRFDIYAEDGLGAQRVLVDALSGNILNSVPLESDCSSASVTDIYRGGNRTIYTDKYTANDYRLKDDCQSASIRIRDWNSSTTSASPVEIENTTNTWNGNNNEKFGGTVLWHVKQSYSYYLNVHSRNSYDNANGDVEGYINAVFACNPPPNPCYYTDNASMSFSGGTMKVGFGSGGTLGDTWGALDIIGHEYTHAVTGSSSQLVYQDESGALNESFSDIFGDAIERNTFGSNDWLVGADRTSGAIRSMSNPNAGNDPDTYLGTFWKTTGAGQPDNGGVHSNSGVQNYWFYLLGVGNGTVTTGTNDNGDAFSVTGIGFNAARAIAYRNNVVKLTSGSNYASARAGAIAAAEDLYGPCSNQVLQVKNAWYAVGVGNPGGPTFNTTNTSPAVCSGVAFSIDLQSYRTANFVTPIYRWFASYPAGITGGNGDCLGNSCGTSINETLYNNTTVPLTVTYTFTRVEYDGCLLPAFSISKVINPRPTVSNSTDLSVGCSGDPFSINLQNNVTNGVPSNFTWTVNYNGLTNGSGNGSGDYINETLINLTGSAASAVYTVTAYSEQGSCQGPSFTVTVPVPPVLSTSVDATSDYNGFDVSCNGGSDGVAEAFPVGGTPPYSYSWNDPNGQTTKVATGLMALNYTVVVTDANGCEATNNVTLTEPDPLTIDAGENQTVYYGYPPAECADIAWSGEGGGVPPYTITWDDGGAQSHQVCPGNTTTTYTVTITDANGCVETDSVKICVIDIRCGNNLDKVEICHVPEEDPLNTQTLCVSVNAVETHLAHGDMLAACGTDHTCSDAKSDFISLTDNNYETTLSAYPNPFSVSTTIEFTNGREGKITVQLYDFTGRMLKEIYDGDAELATKYEIRVDAKDLSPGLNLCVLRHSDGTVLIKKLLMHK
ncbi:MAG: M4 family metallopeptidase [bacterium]